MTTTLEAQSINSGETRQFRVHPKLLFDVIQRQAGTLSKAILESVMNSADAKATKCEIKVLRDRVIISDNGQGFRNREEIETWFEEFGRPHEESEGKVYGTFRMGRGQGMSFGVNYWRSGKFAMEVDVANKGLDYVLKDNEPKVKGCHVDIELYNTLSPTEMSETTRDLEHWCKWAPITVRVNEKKVSKDPAKAKWDIETDEAYIKLQRHGGLSVYNLGVHTMTFDGWRLGTGGEVVTKQQVKVNFARNDIQSDCKVWKRVRGDIDEIIGRQLPKKKTLTDNERQRIVDKWITDESPLDDLDQAAVITAVTGRNYPVSDIYRPWGEKTLSLAPKGNFKGDVIHRQNIAFVVAQETLDRFHVESVPQLMSLLHERHRHGAMYVYRDLETLAAGISDKHSVIKEKDLRQNEKIWLATMRNSMSTLYGPQRSRKLMIGSSDTRNGWTDGDTYIVITREFLAGCDFSVDGITRVARLLLHELCHTSPDNEEHDHDQAFYEDFHDRAVRIGKFIERALPAIIRACNSNKKKLTKKTLTVADKIHDASHALEALNTSIATTMEGNS